MPKPKVRPAMVQPTDSPFWVGDRCVPVHADRRSYLPRLQLDEKLAILGAPTDFLKSYLDLCCAAPLPWGYAYRRLDTSRRRYGMEPEIEDWSTVSEGRLALRDVIDHLLERRLVLGVRRYHRDWLPYFRVLVFDLDAHTDRQRATLRDRVRALHELLPFTRLIFSSSDGGGLHVYYPLAIPCLLRQLDPIRHYLEARLAELVGPGSVASVEVFPKGDNVLRLPLGVGSVLLDENLTPFPLETDKVSQLEHLHTVWTGGRRGWLNLTNLRLALPIKATTTTDHRLGLAGPHGNQEPPPPHLLSPSMYTLQKEAGPSGSLGKSVDRSTSGVTPDRRPHEVRERGIRLLEEGLSEPGTFNDALLAVACELYNAGYTEQQVLQDALERWVVEKNNGLSTTYNRDPQKAIRKAKGIARRFFERRALRQNKRPLAGPWRIGLPQLSNDEQRSVATAANTLAPDGCEERMVDCYIRLARFVKGQLEKRSQPLDRVQIPKDVFKSAGFQTKPSGLLYVTDRKLDLSDALIIVEVSSHCPGRRDRRGRSKAYRVAPLEQWGKLAARYYDKSSTSP